MVSNPTFEQFYRDVPAEQRQRLLAFRAAHPVKAITADGHRWRYFTGGQGAGWLLVLHGGGGNAESLFQQITGFEREYRVLAPTYPATLRAVDDVLAGFEALYRAEGIGSAHAYGLSLGGGGAQALVRHQPGAVRSMILSHTAPPTPWMGRDLRRRLRRMTLIPSWAVLAIGRRRLRGRLELAADSVPPEERAFWEAFRAELYATSLTKADVLARTRMQIDYHLNLRYGPHDLDGWPGRVLIIESDRDQNIPADVRAALRAAYPRARVHTFRGIGHSGGLTLTEQNVALILEFLRA